MLLRSHLLSLCCLYMGASRGVDAHLSAKGAKKSMRSPAEMLAGLSEADRAAKLETLDDETRAYLATHWAFWARPDQMMPLGDWSIWLPLAGRGGGKR